MEGTLGMDYSSDRRIYTLSNGNTEALVVDTFVCISHINAGVAKIFFMHCRYFSCTVDIFYALYIFFTADPAELGVRAVPVRHVDQQRRPLLHSLHPPPAGHRAGQVSLGSNKYYITSVYHTIYCDIMSI